PDRRRTEGAGDPPVQRAGRPGRRIREDPGRRARRGHARARVPARRPRRRLRGRRVLRARAHQAAGVMRADLPRRAAAELVGTALLLATVVGSGIMAERLAAGNAALALLANTLATGAGLAALILTFGGVSGAHFNPVVTIADASQGGIAWRDVGPYIAA